MITVSATEFSKNFGKYREVIQREPIAITAHERITGYFISPIEYNEYMNLKAKMPKAFFVEELSEETIRALANSRMDAKHDHLNELLDE